MHLDTLLTKLRFQVTSLINAYHIAVLPFKIDELPEFDLNYLSIQGSSPIRFVPNTIVREKSISVPERNLSSTRLKNKIENNSI